MFIYIYIYLIWKILYRRVLRNITRSNELSIYEYRICKYCNKR